MPLNRLTKSSLVPGLLSMDSEGVFLTKKRKKFRISVLEKWCTELNISVDQVAYIGDDINDVAIMEKVGLSACPADAVNQVKSVANIILNKDGGKACVREFLDEWI